MKNIISIMLILLFGFTFAGLNATILDINQIYQIYDQWCWAACSEAILEYYGFEFDQYQIALYGTEGLNIWNWLYGYSENPTRRGINLILYFFGEIESTPLDTPLGLNASVNHINSLRPFVIRWGWTTGGGHFVVCKGIVEDIFHLMDPWYGPTINDYSWTLQSLYHTWTHTLLVDSEYVSTDDNVIVTTGTSEIKSIYPNPFNPSTTVSFLIDENTHTTLEIYNIKGNRVKTLLSEVLPSGQHSVVWNGLDDAGYSVSSGVYLLRLRTDKQQAVRKMVVVK